MGYWWIRPLVPLGLDLVLSWQWCNDGACLCLQTSGQIGSQGWGQGGATIPYLPPNPSSSASDEKLTPEQLDLILRFNDAIQQHLHTPGDARREDSSVDPHDPLRRGMHGQLAPSGARQPAQNTRPSMQNIETGEDVPDVDSISASLDWVSEEEESHFAWFCVSAM